MQIGRVLSWQDCPLLEIVDFDGEEVPGHHDHIRGACWIPRQGRCSRQPVMAEEVQGEKSKQLVK